MRESELLAILLLAISSNGDNVGVGAAYGMRRIHVPMSSNLLIAVVTGIGTFASMIAGESIGNVMEPRLAGVLGGAIIAGIGVWVILQSARSAGRADQVQRVLAKSSHNVEPGMFKRLKLLLDDPVVADRDSSRHIDVREGWLLAVALSLNNVVNGVAAGMVRMSPVLTTLFVTVFSMLTLKIGLVAGHHCRRGRWLSSCAGLTSGLLLVFIGVWEFRV